MTALEALRKEGAARLDPVRFAYLEALSRRMAGRPEPVRCALQSRLDGAVAEYAQRFAREREPRPIGAPGGIHRSGTGATRSPLARLNEQIRLAAAPDELASVQRFRQAWTRSRREHQVEQAVARKPANAGPLNSHVLVLQSLTLMRELSPEYLRHFLAHVESLQWLELVEQRESPQTVRQAKAGKALSRARLKK